MISHLLRELILPPGCLILTGVFFLVLSRKKVSEARIGLGVLFAVFYLLSIPLVATGLTRSTYSYPPMQPEQIQAFQPQAVVVLGAGLYRDAPEFGGQSELSDATFRRLNYGAYLSRLLQQRTVLVTGGFGTGKQDSEAEVSARVLKEWGVQHVLVESESKNTHQNAVNSRQLAKAQGIERIALVTAASHIGRAATEFRQAGFQVLPCATGYRTSGSREEGLFMLVPTHEHFNESSYALRCHLANLWYYIAY